MAVKTGWTEQAARQRLPVMERSVHGMPSGWRLAAGMWHTMFVLECQRCCCYGGVRDWVRSAMKIDMRAENRSGRVGQAKPGRVRARRGRCVENESRRRTSTSAQVCRLQILRVGLLIGSQQAERFGLTRF
ncbi:hypothetical protein BS50DRAFT_272241 [Corynespora cassiicola Philippines]|uniref:Uncharacterized protein n=1 Tax=Corynespora cassiicola Philippines TaxID=1448308 RepID=A0A2T2P033_CORCC|nr:hypothetical protein BS50DRAFT_272241 [Corynespora cassiicola Philippines]